MVARRRLVSVLAALVLVVPAGSVASASGAPAGSPTSAVVSSSVVTGTIADGAPSYPDVPVTHAFFEPISWLGDEGITRGYADGTYRPASAVTRGQMAAFLFRYAGPSGYTAPVASPFPDVPTDHAFYAAICWLAEQGITEGYGDGQFKPARVVTRGAMAAFLYRLAGRPAFTVPGEATFPDVRASHSRFVAVEWLAGTGVTTGYASGVFAPTDPVTRGQMAAFLWRYDDWADPLPRVTTEESSATAPAGVLYTVSAPSISADGRWLAYQASGWTPDQPSIGNLLLKDRTTGEVSLVTRTASGSGPNAGSWGMVGADGDHVLFQSSATDLAGYATGLDWTGSEWHVYLADRYSGALTRVSSVDGGPANGWSHYADLSDDSRWAVFSSIASDLVAADTDDSPDVFVQDLDTGAIERVATLGGEAWGQWFRPVISGDGRWVASCERLRNGDALTVVDRQTGATTVIANVTDREIDGAPNPIDTVNCESLDISADGRWVVFTSWVPLDPQVPQGVRAVYLWDRTTQETTLVSAGTYGSAANGWSSGASISADGRWITYASSGTKLVPRDTATWDVYVTDRITGRTARVSAAPDGTGGNRNSSWEDDPWISADGRWISYVSWASNLVTDDPNGRTTDVFVTSNPLLP